MTDAAATLQADLPPAGPSRLHLWKEAAAAWLDSRQLRLVPTVMTLLGVPVLLVLGTWQLQRMDEKNIVLAQMEKNLVAAPEDLRLAWPRDAAAWRALDGRPVTLQGQFLEMRRFKLAPRTYDGQNGYQLIQPLRLKDDTIVLVNRGFVPADQEIMPQPGEAALDAVLRVPEAAKPNAATPDNRPDKNQWVWIDLPAMGRQTGFAQVAPVMAYELRQTGRDSFPIGGQLPLPQHNRHWHYAVTWYAMALILTGVFIMTLSPAKAAQATPKDDKGQTPERRPADDLSDPVARRGMYPEATD